MLKKIMLTAALLPALVLADDSDKLSQLATDYWQNELKESPFSATQNGASKFNRLVPSVAPKDHRRRTKQAQKFLKRLNQIDVDTLSDSEQVDLEVLRFILRHNIDLAEYNNWRIPILADSGFHLSMNYVVGATPFRNEDDYQDYLARLEALPSFLDQHVANMRQGLKDGFTQPKQILDGILPSFAALVVADPTKHPLYRPFKNPRGALSPDVTSRLQEQAKVTLRETVIPAYERAYQFMQQEYLPNAVDRIGSLYLPNGKARYQALVRYYTTLDDATPESIHELGLKEVARIRGEMDEIIQEVEFEGSFEEFLEFLRTDPQFYAKTPQRLLERAAWLAKVADGKLPAFFGKMPRQPYSVEPVPEGIAPNYTTGRYVGASLESGRGGQYWVNTYALDKRPLYQLPALTLHEAVPGHHFQIALTKEVENVPEFRRQFYPHAYGEGWGLYSEKLGVEMGMYQTPYEHFGRLSYEMWRACRLVIDTGIHNLGWTRKQAMDYLASNTALSLHNVQTEVDRYISWPGQALAYKMGELTIWELRRQAEQELGDDFDIRSFHDAVLVDGGVPLELLRKRIHGYIEDNRLPSGNPRD